MQTGYIVFIVIYLAVLIAYFFHERLGAAMIRKTNKTLLAALYFFFAAEELIRLHAPGDTYLLLLLCALMFCMLGDIVLIFSLVKGAALFFVGNLLFFVFELVLLVRYGIPFRDIWPFLPAAAILLGAVYALAKLKWLKFGKLKSIALVYLASVTLNGMLGLSIALQRGGAMRLLGFGVTLFMISDYFLIYREFRKKKRLAGVLNTATYFPGMLLAALSMSRFVL